MTPEERQAISGLFDRMKALTAERDPEAEQLIRQRMEQDPQTKYYIAQLAYFLEHAQAESQNRIQQLEWQLQNAQQTAQPAQAGGGGFLSGLFGGGGARRATLPPPAPVHAPGYRPGMFQNQGGGFFAGAMQTAMGVAGGLLLGNMLMSMFDPGVAEAAEPVAEEPVADEVGYEEEMAGEDFGGFDEL